MFIAAKTVTTRTHPAACHDQCRPTLRLTGASGGIIPQERIQSMPQLLLDREKIGASLQKRLRRPDKPANAKDLESALRPNSARPQSSQSTPLNAGSALSSKSEKQFSVQLLR
jgi:hypothetical protein